MMKFDRTNTGFLSRWWWTVDRYLVIAIALILSIGSILVMASSPSVANRIGLEPYYFINRQAIFICMAIVTMFVISLLSPVAIRRMCILGFIVSILLLITVLFVGVEIKGAKRWISIAGFSVQPSEFAKTFFVVLTAWILSRKYTRPEFKSFNIAIILYCIFVGLLILEPDFGTTVIVTVIWGGQMFLAGLPWVFAIIVGAVAITGAVAAYAFFPHVAARINNFIDPSTGDNYQVTKSLQSFLSGGLFGRGPGQGIVKDKLPDSHTDFIFAVAGEELGLIACLIIVLLFAFIVIRGLMKLTEEDDIFVVFAVGGILMQFGLQALINMSVALHFIPTKGMTLPFISYGGSSMLAVAMAMGIVLALTRKRYGIKKRITHVSVTSNWVRKTELS